MLTSCSKTIKLACAKTQKQRQNRNQKVLLGKVYKWPQITGMANTYKLETTSGQGRQLKGWTTITN